VQFSLRSELRSPMLFDLLAQRRLVAFRS